MDRRVEQETGLALGLVLLAILAALLIAALSSGLQAGPFRAGQGTTFLGLYIMGWGAMFLASYHAAHRTFLFPALLWVCEHWSHPKGRGMALVYAAVALLFGGFVALTGLGLVGAAG